MDSEIILDSEIQAAVQQVNAWVAAQQPSIPQLLAIGLGGPLPSSPPHLLEGEN